MMRGGGSGVGCQMGAVTEEVDEEQDGYRPSGLITFKDDGNYIIMDVAEDDGSGGMVRSSGVMNAVQDHRKQTSFMEKLMGVKNSQCDLYLDRIHRELDQVKVRNVRGLQNETVKIQYDLKLMQVDLKRQEIQEKKKTNPRSDTSLDEAMVEKSAKYLQCNNVNPCYLDKTIGYPLRRSIRSDYVSPMVRKARKVLQDQSVEQQISKAQDDRKSMQSRRSQHSRRSVHFQMESPVHQTMDVDNDTGSNDSDGKSDRKSAKSQYSSSKSASSKDTASVSILANGKRPRTSFSTKATLISYPTKPPNSGEEPGSGFRRPLLTRSASGVDGFKFLLLNDQERSGLPSRMAKAKSADMHVDNTDVNAWAEHSARYSKNQAFLPNINKAASNNSKHNQDTINNNNSTNDSSEGGQTQVVRKLDIVDSPQDKTTFLNLITSWKGTASSGGPQSRASSAVTRRQSCTSASSSRRPNITHTMLRQEQVQINRRIQNFYRTLQEDKRQAQLAAARHREQQEQEQNGEGEQGEDDVIKAINASKSLTGTVGDEGQPQPSRAAINPFAKSARPSKAKLRWQRAIRKVIDNLDDMLKDDLDDPYLNSNKGPLQGQRQSSMDRFKGLNEQPKTRGLGPPSNSLRRSKRHSATFKLQKVVAELLKNKNTFQRLQYEQTKQQIIEEGKES